MNNNKKVIDEIAEWYDSPEGFTKNWYNLYKKLVFFRYNAIKPFLEGNIILEVGIANGEMTQYLFQHFEKVIGLEGSSHFIEEIKKRFPEYYKSNRLELIHSLLEDYSSDIKYDIILFSHILEHLDKPGEILLKLKKWIKKDGKIIILVPNANSLHRQVGVKMGLLNRIDDLNDLDKKLGHKRVYTWDTLKETLIDSGLKIVELGGYFLKPLANYQIEKWFTEKMIDAFFELGKKYQEMGVEIYAICICEK